MALRRRGLPVLPGKTVRSGWKCASLRQPVQHAAPLITPAITQPKPPRQGPAADGGRYRTGLNVFDEDLAGGPPASRQPRHQSRRPELTGAECASESSMTVPVPHGHRTVALGAAGQSGVFGDGSAGGQ